MGEFLRQVTHEKKVGKHKITLKIAGQNGGEHNIIWNNTAIIGHFKELADAVKSYNSLDTPEKIEQIAKEQAK